MVAISIIYTMMQDSGMRLWDAAFELLIAAVVFGALALLFKRKTIVSELKTAGPEIRINLLFHAINAILLAPLVMLCIVITERLLGHYGISLLPATFWDFLPAPALLLATLFFGDLIGYLRHRIEHSEILWPVHAVHHSDTHLTWTSFARIHPINQVTTAMFDLSLLMLLGIPDWAITGAFLTRHYYGMLIHANLPWTFGILGHVFVSPAMHHWHHVREGEAMGKNFSIVFAFIDKMFGTFYLPGPCVVASGVDDEMGEGFTGQITHPLKVWNGWLEEMADPAINTLFDDDARKAS